MPLLLRSTQSVVQSVGQFDRFASCRVPMRTSVESISFFGIRKEVVRMNDVQTIQSNAFVQRHDAVPAVAGPVDLIAEADAADVALLQGRGGCCCQEEGERGGEEGMHCRCFDVESLSWRRCVCAMCCVDGFDEWLCLRIWKEGCELGVVNDEIWWIDCV